MDRWNGKVAIVTGASAGIGRAIVTKLVENGMIVAGLARRKERLDEIASTLKDKKGTFHGIKADMTKVEDILKACEYVSKNLGPIHILINNAGVTKVWTLTEAVTEDLREVLETNVLGLSIATREVIQNMLANNVNGHIIHMNSLAGHPICNTPAGMYSGSKWAVTSLTESLRRELSRAKSKIKITSISPGYVDTDIFDVAYETSRGVVTKEELENFKQINPKIEVENIVDCVVYVLGTPPHVQVHEIIIKPVGETL